MDVPRRIARSRVVLITIAAAVFGGISGCNTFALEPSDFLPSKETWEKMSPSNLWYDLQPSRLNRLNEGSPGMSSDAYYSVSDPLPPARRFHNRRATCCESRQEPHVRRRLRDNGSRQLVAEFTAPLQPRR